MLSGSARRCAVTTLKSCPSASGFPVRDPTRTSSRRRSQQLHVYDAALRCRKRPDLRGGYERGRDVFLLSGVLLPNKRRAPELLVDVQPKDAPNQLTLYNPYAMCNPTLCDPTQVQYTTALDPADPWLNNTGSVESIDCAAYPPPCWEEPQMAILL